MKALLVIASAAVLAIAGCSSSSDTADDTATSPTATSESTSSERSAKCTEEDLAAALPEGSTITSYDCADIEGTEWAGVEVSEGPTVFFLQRDGDMWDVSTADEICGEASVELPTSLLAYCDRDASVGGPTDSETSDS